MDTVLGIIFLIIGLAVGIFIYFFPSFVAYYRGKKNTTAIFILNLFLGWTIIGWVIALVWACTEDK